MLKIEGLTDGIFYENLCLEIKENEIIGICGDNGCGKSTLIKFILNIYNNYQGSIIFNNQIISNNNIDLLRLDIQVVFQNPYIQFIGHKVIDEYTFRDEQLNTNNFIYDEFKSKYYNQELAKLSGGQAQMLAIDSCLIHKPKLLIIDESLSNINEVVKQELIAKLKSIDCAVLLITNNLNDLKYCDKSYKLINKKLQNYHINLNETKNLNNDSNIIYQDKIVLKQGFNIIKGSSAVGKSHLLNSLFGLNDTYKTIKNSKLVMQYPLEQIYFINFIEYIKNNNFDLKFISLHMNNLNLDTNLLKKDAINLSTGELSILLILCYISIKIEVLLLDETLEVVDLERRIYLLNILGNFNVVFVTHNIHLYSNYKLNIVDLGGDEYEI